MRKVVFKQNARTHKVDGGFYLFIFYLFISFLFLLSIFVRFLML